VAVEKDLLILEPIPSSRRAIAFAAPVDGWLLHSPPTQQHTNHITKLKTFPVSTLLDLF
jgi:hypothetical protein